MSNPTDEEDGESVNEHGLNLTSLKTGETYTAYIGDTIGIRERTEDAEPGWERVTLTNIDHENDEYQIEYDNGWETYDGTVTGDQIKPPEINPHGVDLTDVETGEWYTIEKTSDGRRRAEIKDIDRENNEVVIKYDAIFEVIEETVSADHLRPHVTEVDNPISREEFHDLAPGDLIGVYLTGYELRVTVEVESIDHEEETVKVRGYLSMYGDITIHRDIPRELIGLVKDK